MIEANNNEKRELEAKLAELQNTINEKENAEKVEVIENAVKGGLIDAVTKDIYVNSSKTTEELKDVFSKLKPAYTPVFDNKTVATNAPVGREAWTHLDWQKKDPKGLAEMQNSSPVAYNELLQTLKN